MSLEVDYDERCVQFICRNELNQWRRYEYGEGVAALENCCQGSLEHVIKYFYGILEAVLH